MIKMKKGKKKLTLFTFNKVVEQVEFYLKYYVS